MIPDFAQGFLNVDDEFIVFFMQKMERNAEKWREMERNEEKCKEMQRDAERCREN